MKMKHCLCCFVQLHIGATLGIYAHHAYAQIAPSSTYDQNLKDVVVEATRSGTPLNEVPLNTTILTKEVLEIAPDQSIDQVLKNVPGIILNDQPYYQKDPTGQSINTRGLGNARTLVLIDGVPANDAFYGTVQWNLVPMSSIDSVEYIRGGVSSLWGNYGMGGVINIKTKNPTNSQQDVSASYGAFGTGNVAASKDIIASDKMQLRLSADYFSTDGYQNIATISPAPYNNIKNGQGPASSHNSNFRMQGYFKPNSDTNGFFRMGYHTMADLSSGYSFAKNLIQETDLSGGVTTKLDSTSKVMVNLYYENTIFNKQNGSTSSTVGVSNNVPYISATYQNPYSTTGGAVQYSKDIKGWLDQIVFAFDARNIGGSNLANNFNTTSIAGSSGSLISTTYAKGQQNFYGLMSEIKSVGKSIPLAATLSARIDNWSSDIPTNYNQAPGSAVVAQTASKQNKTFINPNFGLLYKLDSNWDIRSSVYKAFHAPGMNNTLRTYGSSSGWTFANPNLTPETMVGYEFGTDYRWKQGFAQLTAFNNYVQNAVQSYRLSSSSSSDVALANSLCGGSYAAGKNALNTTSTTVGGVCNSQSVSYYTNSQNLLSQGIEAQYHHDLSSMWAVDLNYAYTQTKYTVSYTSDPANKQVGGVPRNIAGGGLTFYPVPKASITTTLRYVSTSWLNTTNSLVVPTYTIVGLRANYEVAKNTTIYASVVNLLNRQYITFGTGSNASSYLNGMPQAFSAGARIIF